MPLLSLFLKKTQRRKNGDNRSSMTHTRASCTSRSSRRASRPPSRTPSWPTAPPARPAGARGPPPPRPPRLLLPRLPPAARAGGPSRPPAHGRCGAELEMSRNFFGLFSPSSCKKKGRPPAGRRTRDNTKEAPRLSLSLPFVRFERNARARARHSYIAFLGREKGRE